MSDLVWQHLNVCPEGDPDDTIVDAALAVRDGTIAWLGAAISPESAPPRPYYLRAPDAKLPGGRVLA